MADGRGASPFNDTSGRLTADVEVYDEGVRYEVFLSGQVETGNSHLFTAWMNRVLDVGVPPTMLVVDMTGVSYVSSAGIGAFVGLMVDCNKRTISLELRGVSDRVKGVFELLGFASFFTFS